MSFNKTKKGIILANSGITITGTTQITDTLTCNSTLNVSGSTIIMGNTGIGVSPTSKLHIMGSANTNNLVLDDSVSNFAIKTGAKLDEVKVGWATLDSNGTGAVSNGIALWDNMTVQGGFAVGTTTEPGQGNALINGILGIGTTTAHSRLHVNGAITLEGENYPGTNVLDNSVENANKTNTYIKFQSAGADTDFAYLRQIGGSDSICLALDFHDVGNADVNFIIRGVHSANNPDIITNAFVVKGTNVGIGNDAPATSFHISKSVPSNNDTSNMITFQNTYSTYYDWQIGPQNITGQSIFSIRGGNENFSSLTNFININGATGYLGIGIDVPTTSLHVSGASTIVGNTTMLSDLNVVGNITGNRMFITNNNSNIDFGYASLEIGGTAGSYIDMKAPASDDYDYRIQYIPSTGISHYLLPNEPYMISTNGSERMRINGNGNVGIGTNNPSSILHVSGSTILNGSTTIGTTFINGAMTTNSSLNVSGSTVILGSVGISTSTLRDKLNIYKGGLNLESDGWTGDNYLRFIQNHAGGNTEWLMYPGLSGGIGQIKFKAYPSGTSPSGFSDLLTLHDNLSTDKKVLINGRLGIGTTNPSSLLETSTDQGIGLTLTRTNAGGNFGSGILHSLIDNTNQFKANYVRVWGSANGFPATTNQNQANGAYIIDLASNGAFKTDGDFSISALYMTNAQANFNVPKLSINTNTAANFNLLVNGSGHFGEGYDPINYGQVQITRATNQNDTKFHLSFVRAGNAVYGMGCLNNSNTFGIQYGNTSEPTGIFMNTNGNVGIGTPTPNARLQVAGNTIVGIDNIPSALIFNDIAGARWAINTGGYSLSFGKHASTSSSDFSTFETKMTLDLYGNMGIGTIAPATRLHITKPFTDNSAMITFENSLSGYFDWQIGPQVIDNSAYFSIRGGNDSYASLSNLININGSGYLGINTVPSVPLQVGTPQNLSAWGNIYTSSANANFVVSNDGTRTVFMGCDTSGYGMVGTHSNHDFVIRTNNTVHTRFYATSGSILTYGNITADSFTPSDSNFKTGTSALNLTTSISIITNTEPVTFTWKNSFYNVAKRNTTDVGFIAQDIENIMPVAVNSFDLEGVPYKNVNYNKFIPHIINYIKDLKTRLDSTEAQLRAKRLIN